MSMDCRVSCHICGEAGTVAAVQFDLPFNRRAWIPSFGECIPSEGTFILYSSQIMEVLRHFPEEEWRDVFPLRSDSVYYEVSWF